MPLFTAMLTSLDSVEMVKMIVKIALFMIKPLNNLISYNTLGTIISKKCEFFVNLNQ